MSILSGNQGSPNPSFFILSNLTSISSAYIHPPQLFAPDFNTLRIYSSSANIHPPQIFILRIYSSSANIHPPQMCHLTPPFTMLAIVRLKSLLPLIFFGMLIFILFACSNRFSMSSVFAPI